MKRMKFYNPKIMKGMIECIERDPKINMSNLSRQLEISRPTAYKYRKEIENMIKQQEDIIQSRFSQIITDPVSMLLTVIKGLKIG